MKKPAKKEVYKIDIPSFLSRKGLTQRDLAKKLNCSIGLVGGWANYSGVPSYEKCLDLLKAGMTISELFGEEVARAVLPFPLTENDIKIQLDDFEEKVGNAIIDLINNGFFKLKKEA